MNVSFGASITRNIMQNTKVHLSFGEIDVIIIMIADSVIVVVGQFARKIH